MAVPHFLVVADAPADLAVVEVDVAVAQAETEHADASAQQFVNRPLQFVKAYGRIELFRVEVVRILVVDQTWGFVHVRTRAGYITGIS